MSKWDSEKEALIKLINDNIPYNTIGEMYGCSGNNIRKIAKNLGIELPKRKPQIKIKMK